MSLSIKILHTNDGHKFTNDVDSFYGLVKYYVHSIQSDIISSDDLSIPKNTNDLLLIR